jgi:ABC-type glycerol-3-phosphate transport system substrate-binding protein
MKKSLFYDLFKKYGDKLLFALALAVLATGIIFQGLKTTPHKDQKVPPIILFTHWWENDSEKEAFLELKKEFEDLHEGIIVTFESKPYEDIRKELFSSGELSDSGESVGKKPEADIFALDLLWVPELLKMGIIEDQWNGAVQPLLSNINVL